MSEGLTEIPKPTTSKGSHYHKAYYAYSGVADNHPAVSINSGELLIEINSFANPYPREKRSISSFIYDFLLDNGATDIIEEYGLEPFEIHVLDKRRTFTEKIVSLFRASLADDPITETKAKIRHFYDLYHLWSDEECKEYALSERFKHEFEELIEHDRMQFKEPAGWQNRELTSSPLINSFDNLWTALSTIYHDELSGLAYASIPSSNEVGNDMKEILALFG